MTTTKDIGDKGEEIAKQYLEEHGYDILETNWRYSRAEIDIIAMDGEVLVFVEVKTRSYDYYGKPEESVGRKKELLMADAGAAYMRQIGHEWEIRFDIVSVLVPKSGKPKIEHFPDAFFPGL